MASPGSAGWAIHLKFPDGSLRRYAPRDDKYKCIPHRFTQGGAPWSSARDDYTCSKVERRREDELAGVDDAIRVELAVRVDPHALEAAALGGIADVELEARANLVAEQLRPVAEIEIDIEVGLSNTGLFLSSARTMPSASGAAPR